ncbi:cob(I)yrinic acid a,c-diamide adenosyltransferase [Halothermothrix orenii]|uniref:Cob(I)yrinic acid a,c-diamide adenosyltransferase n=1 Tax=Halothermothrix orenii (strain H 168 / OCM 544 / DSM 9562) TaxID=373903 RepID=B8CZC7_HALOH|nr:cob(I)yrinic acid a,c-diamide adenosyltransferase [Halothermothrix orenii]ACL70646.1 cob(I)yrinic acid a,c-diamide adenosyltransferase [Halothermothrix orenii H 168]
MKKGLVHIYTGDGKGKTTAAVGLAVRSAGYGKKIYILQFLKGRKTGEKKFFEKVTDITLERANKSTKFFFQMSDEEKQKVFAETKKVWDKLKDIVRDGEYEVVILDEIMEAIANGLVQTGQVKELIAIKDESLELILTGRDAPEELVELADYVTEMKMIKHPYNRQIPARKGIEF